ncbi:MAG: AMP-binding protein, partial [Deltaproteobacteria bacterium]
MPLSREQTQARLDLLASGTLAHTPSQTYTVADRIEEQAAAQAERTFLLFGDTSITYAEFNALANRVAHVLKASAGLKAGDVVAVMIENRPEFIAAWAGLAKLAVTAALLNTNTRGAALSHAIAETGARALIVGAECIDAADGALKENPGLPVYLLEDPAQPSDETRTAAALPADWTSLDRLMDQASTQNPDPEVRRDLKAGDDLFHVFTSGTTGLPKAARLSHMRFLGVGDGMSAIAGYGPDDVIACILPLYHGAAGMVVVSCALSQGAAIMIRRRFSASRFWDDVRRYRVTGCQYIGEVCRYLVNRPPATGDRD